MYLLSSMAVCPHTYTCSPCPPFPSLPPLPPSSLSLCSGLDVHGRVRGYLAAAEALILP